MRLQQRIRQAIRRPFAIVCALSPLCFGFTVGCQSLQMPESMSPSSEILRFQSPDQQEKTNVQPKLPQNSYDEAFLSNAVEARQRDLIAEVRVTGNERMAEHQVLRNVRTRPGRYFDPDQLQQDVDDLWKLPQIKRINGPYVEQTDQGYIITIDIEEKQLLSAVEFVGNRGISDRALKRHLGIKDGQPLDAFEIRMMKTRIEEHYRDKGYPKTQVEILDGTEPGDEKVVFVIYEDEQQRIWATQFEGNTLASDARLKNFVKSKPGVLKVFGGLVKREEIDQDVKRLLQYYHGLGHFNARIGREISESNDGRWLTLKYIIDEGPRYRIRNVSFVGNEKFTNDELIDLVKHRPDEDGKPEFNSAKMNQDVVALRDLYGSMGYVFSNIEAEPRFLEAPGEIDLVYRVTEGKQYRVGSIKVNIEGDYGITRREVVLNRLSLRPGDIIDVRELRKSERRLGSAQIFGGSDPSSPGAPPQISVIPPELRELERMSQASNDSLIY
ncbi:MAG: POTRA domain-containing protein [Pirellulaceae bacterium]